MFGISAVDLGLRDACRVVIKRALDLDKKNKNLFHFLVMKLDNTPNLSDSFPNMYPEVTEQDDLQVLAVYDYYFHLQNLII